MHVVITKFPRTTPISSSFGVDQEAQGSIHTSECFTCSFVLLLGESFEAFLFYY